MILIESKAKCDQCDALYINGVFCHETGCPNSKLKKCDLCLEYKIIYKCSDDEYDYNCCKECF